MFFQNFLPDSPRVIAGNSLEDQGQGIPNFIAKIKIFIVKI
jgi:hypothetical protein